MIGIYKITRVGTNKMCIGKSVNIDINVIVHKGNTLQGLIDEGVLIAEYDKSKFLNSVTLTRKKVGFWKEVQDIVNLEKKLK